MIKKRLKPIKISDRTHYDAPAGKGVVGSVDGVQVVCGSVKLLAEYGIDAAILHTAAEKLRAQSASVIFVGVDGRLAGFVGIADPIKASTKQAIEALRQQHIRVVMLTGDGKTTAEAVGRDLGIVEVIDDMLPQDKASMVQRLQSEGRVVAMAGDGANDAPALAAADVGIAMGTGTDEAMESAGITLLKDDLMGIVRARQLSRATMRNIRQDLVFAFVYNSAGIPLAAGVLYPFFGLLLSPVAAAAAMSLSSLSVVSNALRLRGAKLAGQIATAKSEQGCRLSMKGHPRR